MADTYYCKTHCEWRVISCPTCVSETQEAEIERLRAACEYLRNDANLEADKLHARYMARIEKLEAALAFYAVGSNYINPHCWNSWPCHGSPVDKDGGAKARAALEGK